MYPLTRSLADRLESFLELEYIRPDRFIEAISREKKPLAKLVALFNHVRFHPNPGFRHQELEISLGNTLRKVHCLTILDGKAVKICRRMLWLKLPNELVESIFSYLDDSSFAACTQVCKRFLHVGYEYVASQPKLLEKYVAKKIQVEPQIVQFFRQQVYSIAFDLNVCVGKVNSTQILQRFPNVQKLCLGNTTVDDFQAKQVLAELRHLRCIDLGKPNNLSPTFFARAPWPASLTSVTFVGNYVRDSGVQCLARCCPDLQELNVSNCKKLTRHAFSESNPFHKLQTLNISLTEINDVDLAHILKCCPNLRTLLIMGCNQITGSTLAEWEQVSFLEELNLSGTKLTSSLYTMIVSRAKNLCSLNVGHCEDLSTDAFIQAKYHPRLKNLLAHYCNVDNAGAQNMLRSCQLEMLDLSNCFRLTKHLFDDIPHAVRPKQICLEGTHVIFSSALASGSAGV